MTRLEACSLASPRARVGGCLLLVYLAAATPLAPALTALLASMDRSHHVAIQQTMRGVEVVLRHHCFDSRPHQHGLAARVLILLAQRTTPAQPDHVIQFGTTDTVRETSKLIVEPEPCCLVPDAFPALGAGLRVPSVSYFSSVFPRPPPAASRLLLALRSTVLLL